MSISLQTKNHWKDHRRLTFDSLSPNAQRQIESLHRRMEASGKRSFYLKEIKRILLDEQDRIFKRQRGETID